MKILPNAAANYCWSGGRGQAQSAPYRAARSYIDGLYGSAVPLVLSITARRGTRCKQTLS